MTRRGCEMLNFEGVTRTRACCAGLVGVLTVVFLFRVLLGGADSGVALPALGDEALLSQVAEEEAQPPVLRGSGRTRGSDFVLVEDEKEEPYVLTQVSDLGDGLPVPGLALTVQVSPPGNPRAVMGESVQVTSDEEGLVKLLGRSIHIDASSEEWKKPRNTSGREVLRTKQLWVYKEIDVTIRVVSKLDDSVGFDPAQVSVGWTVLAAEPTPITERPKDPWNSMWARGHGFTDHTFPMRASSEGVVTGRIPRIRGLRIRGTVANPAVSSAIVELDIPSRDAEAVEVVLTFTDVRRHIHGTVRSSDGTPLAGAVVTAYVATVVKTSDLSIDSLRGLGYAFSVVGNTEGESILTFLDRRTTDEEGKYSFSLPPGGELLLVAHGAGHSPSRARYASTSLSEEVNIAARSIESTPEIRFLSKGEPLPGALVILTDLSSEPFQTNTEFRLDDASVARTGWMEVGRDYWILIRPKLPRGTHGAAHIGFIKWDGREEVNISDLPGDLEAFRRK